MTDEILARQAARDPALFTELYRRHLRRVYAYHYARTGSQADAEDLTSQTFMAALEGLERYRAEGSFAAWLLTIARHKLADHYRGTRPDGPLDDGLPDGRPPLEDAALARLQLSETAQALQRLSADRAEAVSLRVFAGLSTAETARLMGRSEAAVKMLLHRALTDLKTILTQEEAL